MAGPPSIAAVDGRVRYGALRPRAADRQGRASPQNFGYRRGGRKSKVTVTEPQSQEEPVTPRSIREHALRQRERYRQLTRRADKRALLRRCRAAIASNVVQPHGAIT